MKEVLSNVGIIGVILGFIYLLITRFLSGSRSDALQQLERALSKKEEAKEQAVKEADAAQSDYERTRDEYLRNNPDDSQ